MTLAYSLDDPRTARPAAALTEVMDRLGTKMTFARDEEIYAQGDDVEFMYRLAKGVIRTSRVTADGRRQVGDFYYPGDLFGLEVGPDHQFSAEALTDCEIQMVRRGSVRAFAGDAELDRAILEATRRELQRVQDHVLLLGRKSAREKVAAFLMSLAQRDPSADVELPMGRQDMADYLGLTIETVSRMLTQLQGDAIVEFPSFRRFHVKKWQALEELVD
ncbi:transcriptional regulator, Crp/Fnr family [Phenylobacterium zucineum HLK1]|uniref:Transcriptional regulator, Crp/Fnr family n=1 Tax=Phenylobacterium zucineum (strain HLK1) TaxID=450851 RepID=B4R889_PHEZH|nr:helix-turn-helix domain-containing protein [Phenylobacterium zucineum]ACG79207.1 transcriptional regulator, Crp/Fnr family [Phenylobacterium zucineum HLK1]